MKKIDTSTRLLKTGPMSSLSESMARYNSLQTNYDNETREEPGKTEIKDTRMIICRYETYQSAVKKDILLLLPSLVPDNGITSNSISR